MTQVDDEKLKNAPPGLGRSAIAPLLRVIGMTALFLVAAPYALMIGVITAVFIWDEISNHEPIRDDEIIDTFERVKPDFEAMVILMEERPDLEWVSMGRSWRSYRQQYVDEWSLPETAAGAMDRLDAVGISDINARGRPCIAFQFEDSPSWIFVSHTKSLVFCRAGEPRGRELLRVDGPTNEAVKQLEPTGDVVTLTRKIKPYWWIEHYASSEGWP